MLYAVLMQGDRWLQLLLEPSQSHKAAVLSGGKIQCLTYHYELIITNLLLMKLLAVSSCIFYVMFESSIIVSVLCMVV
jgi:hypothetical protein